MKCSNMTEQTVRYANVNVAILCESSGKVREAFRKRGHNAWSFDLLPADDESPFHIQGDIQQTFKQPQPVQSKKFPQWNHERKWDLVIAHPPCTYLTTSGARWLYEDRPSQTREERWQGLIDGALFFKWCLELDVPKVAVENPIMLKYARKIVGAEPTQYIQPWQFGHGETKKTGLWLRGLPELKPTNIVEGREQRLHNLPPSEDRWKIRSETYQGIASAMADQWGK